MVSFTAVMTHPQDGHDLSSRNEEHKVYYHRLGSPQSDDQLIYEDNAHPQRFHTLQTTEDEKFAILTVSERGQGKDGNALFFSDLSKFVPDTTRPSPRLSLK